MSEDEAMERLAGEVEGRGRPVTVSVVVPSDLSHHGTAYRRDAPIDAGVAEIVRRLNHPVHGEEPFTRG